MNFHGDPVGAGDSPTRFIILGGFLGAGKTTLAINLGRLLREKYDKSVAIITNDQGDVLVDTEFTKVAGFDVEEVLGGCFCANFDEFVKNARHRVQMLAGSARRRQKPASGGSRPPNACPMSRPCRTILV